MSVEPQPLSSTLVPTPTGPLVVGPAPPTERPLLLSLVIPTYNESKNVGELIDRLTQLLDAQIGSSYELIVVDDDSRDRTWEVALGLAQRYPQVRVMRRIGERGLSTAVVRGWQVARGEILAVIDADLQHPPEVVGGSTSRSGAGPTWRWPAATPKGAASRTGACSVARCRGARSCSAS